MIWIRLAFAIVCTILLLPCLGFGVIGLLHAWGEGPAPEWIVIYLILDVILIAAIAVAWWAAFAYQTKDAGCCQGCGHEIGPSPGDRCPECGQAGIH